MATFRDIVGQDQMKEHMQSAIASGKISHAYVINGEQFSGKEFIAKIFAMALQCEMRGKAGTPETAGNPGTVGKAGIAGESAKAGIAGKAQKPEPPRSLARPVIPASRRCPTTIPTSSRLPMKSRTRSAWTTCACRSAATWA